MTHARRRVVACTAVATLVSAAYSVPASFGRRWPPGYRWPMRPGRCGCSTTAPWSARSSSNPRTALTSRPWDTPSA
jgi:hypothetical protein